MAVFLGFSANIRGVNYPAAAIFKLDRGETYYWAGDHPMEGHLAIFDLVGAQNHFLSGSWQEHGSRHKSGERHQKLAIGESEIKVGTRTDVASADIVSWSSIREVTVPLTEPFDFWPLRRPEWAAVKSPITLRREDFGDDTDGVFLDGYICRHDRVGDLISMLKRTTARSWVACDGEFDLVVLAKVVTISASALT